MDVDVRRQQRGRLRHVGHCPSTRAPNGTLQSKLFIFGSEISSDIVQLCSNAIPGKVHIPGKNGGQIFTPPQRLKNILSCLAEQKKRYFDAGQRLETERLQKIRAVQRVVQSEVDLTIPILDVQIH